MNGTQGGFCIGGADAHLFVGGVQEPSAIPAGDGYVERRHRQQHVLTDAFSGL